MDTLDAIIAARLVERLTLTLVVVVVAVVVLVAFWRGVQKIDITAKDAGVQVSVLLATPVLVLLTLVGFTHVVLVNPVAATAEGTAEGTEGRELTSVRGMAPAAAESADAAAVAGELQALNCALARAAPPAGAAERAAIERLMARAMLASWSEEWGDATAFSRWALGGDRSAAPSGNATRTLRGDLDRC